MDPVLAGQTAVVAGASRGIGLARASYAVGGTSFVDGGMLKTL